MFLDVLVFGFKDIKFLLCIACECLQTELYMGEAVVKEVNPIFPGMDYTCLFFVFIPKQIRIGICSPENTGPGKSSFPV